MRAAPRRFGMTPSLDMWLACATQEEIAEAVSVDQKTVANWQDDFRKNSEAEDFLNDRSFDPPIGKVLVDAGLGEGW